MNNLVDPVQRHIHAIMVRDAIVLDDASDLTAAAVSPKQLQRLLRARLAGVDFVGEAAQAVLDDPPGRRVGRMAFSPAVRALWVDRRWTGPGSAPHRLPENQDEIQAFILQQTNLRPAVGESASDLEIRSPLGFDVPDHARVTDLLRQNGAGSRLFIAASMLSAACAKYKRAHRRAAATGPNEAAVDVAALSVEAALIGTASIATDILLARDGALPRVGVIARHLVSCAETFRRTRSRGKTSSAVRAAAAAANGVHLHLTRGTVHDILPEHDREFGRLLGRLAVATAAMETAVRTIIAEVDAVDGHQLYVLLMARRLDVALDQNPWLAAPHPIFKLSLGYIGAFALFAELERLGVIIRAMAERERQADGTTLDSITIKPALAKPPATQAAIGLQTAAGRYLDLGAYHRAVTTSFIRRKAHWLSATVPAYTHHAYTNGSRFCDLAAAASDASTHTFIRRSELDKPTHQGIRRSDLVLFYGLDIEQTVILALRQVLDRVFHHGTGTFNQNIAFGLTVRRILLHTAPAFAARLNQTSCLDSDEACGKGLANRATKFVRRFDDRDYTAAGGVFFDYTAWFDRDRDIEFWDRLQKGAKLYTAFGSTFIPAPSPAELEALPGRKGRRATRPGEPPSAWRLVMIEARKAFDAYLPLYLKSRPTRLTARIMSRMNQGYCAFSSDPEFRTLFKA